MNNYMEIKQVRVNNIEFALRSALGELTDSKFGISTVDGVEKFVRKITDDEMSIVEFCIDYIVYNDNELVEYVIIGDKDYNALTELPIGQYLKFLEKIIVSYVEDGTPRMKSYLDLWNDINGDNLSGEEILFIKQLPYARDLLVKI